MVRISDKNSQNYVCTWSLVGHSIGETMKTLAKRITAAIKEKSTSGEDKRVIGKLKQSFETELNAFKATTQAIEGREKDILVSMSVVESSPLTRNMGVDAFQAQAVGPSAEVVMDHAQAIKEKQAAIHQIERDVVLLNDMFKDLNYLVVEQQVGIDLIENNIHVAKDQTAKGHAELVDASDYQSASRRQMCYICIILLVVIGVVLAIVLGVTLPKK